MIIAYFDGGCWPNPGGEAAAGVFIEDGPDTLLKEGFYVGNDSAMSCNVAEYEGLIYVLQFLKDKGFTDKKILVRGDSKLVINQMAGRWKIKQGLYFDSAIQAKALVEGFTDISFEWIPRDENTICDELAEDVLVTKSNCSPCRISTPVEYQDNILKAIKEYYHSKKKRPSVKSPKVYK